MANNDLVTRLLLDSKQFDITLGKSKNQVADAEKRMQSYGKSGVGAFKAFAGAAGLAFGGIETFTRAMSANDDIADQWEATMRAASNSVDQFFTSIESGDFSVMDQGLSVLIDKAKEAADALDHYGDVMQSMSYAGAINESNFNDARAILKDPNSTAAQKEAARQQAIKAVESENKYAKSVYNSSRKAYKSVLVERSLLSESDITEGLIDKVAKVPLEDLDGSKDKEYRAQLQQFKLQYKNLKKQSYNAYRQSPAMNEQIYKEFRSQVADLAGQYGEALMYDALWGKGSKQESRDAIFQTLKSGNDAVSKAREMSKTLYGRVLNDSSTGSKSGKSVQSTSVAAAASPIEGTIAWYEKQVSELNKIILNATTDEARSAAQATINEYESKIAEMRNKAARDAEPTFETIEKITPSNSLKDNNALKSNTTLLDSNVPSLKIDKYTTSIKDMDAETSNAIGSITSIIGLIGELTHTTDKSTQSWIQYGVSIVSAIAQAIPSIVSLTTVQTASANADAKKAAAGAGASVASIPYVGAIMAVAAIGSVVAAMAAIPKFAEGGIVGGNSYYGDKLMARLNSGEAVLNQGQQAKLLNSLDRQNDVKVTGTVVLRNKDVAIMLENYDKYKNQ